MPTAEVLEYWSELVTTTQLEFWRVRQGGITVYDWSLEEALASAARVKSYAKLFRATGSERGR